MFRFLFVFIFLISQSLLAESNYTTCERVLLDLLNAKDLKNSVSYLNKKDYSHLLSSQINLNRSSIDSFRYFTQGVLEDYNFINSYQINNFLLNLKNGDLRSFAKSVESSYDIYVLHLDALYETLIYRYKEVLTEYHCFSDKIVLGELNLYEEEKVFFLENEILDYEREIGDLFEIQNNFIDSYAHVYDFTVDILNEI